ncbi:MAG: glycosyltransferase [Alphaproteobacteria bacterium]|nr:glycosyltransferase [Alphaproteobacteria bacterium]
MIVVYDEGAQGASQLGGGQIARIALLAALDRSLFRPILLTSSDGELAAAARAAGVEVVVRDINARCPRVRRRDLARRPLALAQTAWAVLGAGRRLAVVLGDLRADVLHPNENLSRTVALLSRAWRRVPTVIHIDNEWNQGPADVVMRALFLRGFDRLIGVSNRVIEAADPAGRFRRKIVLIPTGIDPARFVGHGRDAVRRDLGFAPKDFAIVTVGRLEALKGQGFGIDAVARLRRDHGIRARYVLIGEGPDRDTLAAQAGGFGEDVRFLGQRNDVPRLLAGMDVLLHPSMTEAHPLVVVEGLLAGLPVVATDVGGTAEILERGRFGRLVPVGDSQAMADALAELAALSPADRARLVGSGRAHAVAIHALAGSVRLTEAVYRDLAGRS